jgi:hypothetical protein
MSHGFTVDLMTELFFGVTAAGVASHGLSCEVCKCKVHKRCAVKAISNCKWTTLASIGKDIIEDEDRVCTFMSSYYLNSLKPSFLSTVPGQGTRFKVYAMTPRLA